MNPYNIKKMLETNYNRKLRIKVYIGRNKYEYYEGYINKIYNNIFTINTNIGIKAFSYSDIITKIVSLQKID